MLGGGGVVGGVGPGEVGVGGGGAGAGGGEAGGGVTTLFTVTVIWVWAVLFEVSVATTVMVCEPLVKRVVFQETA